MSARYICPKCGKHVAARRRDTEFCALATHRRGKARRRCPGGYAYHSLKVVPKSHRHRWRVASWCGYDVQFRCSGCHASRKRKMTPEEWRRHKLHHGFRPRSPAYDVHKVWHRVERRLGDGWKQVTAQDPKLGMGDMLGRMARYYPGHIYPLRCDDSYFASSDLVLITHEDKEGFMGTTVLMFPQCDGAPPAEFFLYPDHVGSLVKALAAITKRTRRLKRIEARVQRRDDAWWARRKP